MRIPMPRPGRTVAAAEATPPPFSAALRAPFAVLGIRTANQGVTGIEYLPPDATPVDPTDRIAEQCVMQLLHYLRDPQWRFTLPLSAGGTVFRQRVWHALTAIPVGESRTYGEVARALHTAPRAIGGACGANPIALVIPCHRVVGSQGALGGFMNATRGDPVAIKRWLLTHEGYRFGV